MVWSCVFVLFYVPLWRGSNVLGCNLLVNFFPREIS
jgi:hypothetical protein